MQPRKIKAVSLQGGAVGWPDNRFEEFDIWFSLLDRDSISSTEELSRREGRRG